MSSIAEFYSGKNIFITGATGFLAKVIIEKILRSCPDVSHIYILMRSKKNRSIKDRLSDITSSPLFEKLREKNASQLRKLIPIAGDLEEDNLGISDEDRTILIENVSIVIHSAANVKFNEPLEKALKINVEATRDILNLCRELNNFQVFAHVSTGYVSGNNFFWKEDLNLSKYTPYEMIELVKKISPEELKKRESEIIEGFPNTYTFSKSLAEVLICSEARKDNLPVVILRPSIITGTMNEPMSGYIDNAYGSTIVIILIGKGIFHVAPFAKQNILSLIPVDLVSNAVISAAWKTALDRSSGTIYNVCSSCVNSIDCKTYWDLTKVAAFKYPLSSNPAWYMTLTFRMNKYLLAIHFFFANFLPAAIYDIIGMLKGKKANNIKAAIKVWRMVENYKFFWKNSFYFSSENIPKLINSMSESDRIEFNCDPKSIRWNEYFVDYVRGIRKYLLKKPDETIMEDRMKIQRLKPLHYLVKYTFLVLIGILVAGTIFLLLRLFFNIDFSIISRFSNLLIKRFSKF